MYRYLKILIFLVAIFARLVAGAQCPTNFVHIVGRQNPLCDTSQLDWGTWQYVNDTSGLAVISSQISVTVSKPSGGMLTSPNVFAGNLFPTQYNLPINSTSLRNDLLGLFTFCFSVPVTNPVIALASIGNGGLTVPVVTSAPYTVIWAGPGMTYPNDTTFTGTEGYTIVQFPGTFTCITFDYLASETYCNVDFGIIDTNCQTYAIPPVCPGNPDTLRATGAVTYTWSPSTGLNTTTGALVVANPLVSTTYYATGTNASGCTATDSFTVHVLSAYNDTVTQSICPGGSYTFNGNTYTQAGNYTIHYQTINACDSAITLNLTVNPAYSDTFAAGICPGSSYSFNGNSYTQAGYYPATYQTVNGCDSTITLNLSVYPVYYDTTIASVCSGTDYPFQNNIYTTAGTYTLNYNTVNGCDSDFTLVLTLNPVYHDTIVEVICQGASYSYNGNSYALAGYYPNTLQTINSCDSIVTLHLIVNPVYSDTINAGICPGSSYTYNGNSISQAGYYPDTLQTINGCDSVVTLHLVINPVYSDTTQASICYGSSYTFQNQTYNAAGAYTVNYNTVNGCDSNLTLVLTVYPTYQDTVSPSICSGQTYTLPNGSTATTPGVYNTMLNTVHSCDSLITTILQVNPTYTQSTTDTICAKQTYVLPDGSTVTGGGVYISRLTTVNNCDSIISTQLVINSEPAWFQAYVTPATATVNLGKSIALTVGANQTGPLSYAWTPGTGLTCNDCPLTTFNGNTTTSYSVTVTDTNGCEAFAGIDVEVLPDYQVFVPNVFTPNGDGHNDQWQIFGNKAAMKLVEVAVFDRLGEKVFESTDINFMWDGTFRGRPAPAGVYVYNLTIVWLNDVTAEPYKGTITLLR